jgi:hypothetical protein
MSLGIFLLLFENYPKKTIFLFKQTRLNHFFIQYTSSLVNENNKYILQRIIIIIIIQMPPKKSSTLTQPASSSSSDDNVENDDIIKQMVNASIQYILIHSSKAQVIKRLDWTNIVLRPMAFDGRKYFSNVHKQVTKILDQTFGYKLVEDEKHDGKKNKQTNKIFNLLFKVLY